MVTYDNSTNKATITSSSTYPYYNLVTTPTPYNGGSTPIVTYDIPALIDNIATLNNRNTELGRRVSALEYEVGLLNDFKNNHLYTFLHKYNMLLDKLTSMSEYNSINFDDLKHLYNGKNSS